MVDMRCFFDPRTVAEIPKDKCFPFCMQLLQIISLPLRLLIPPNQTIQFKTDCWYVQSAARQHNMPRGQAQNPQKTSGLRPQRIPGPMDFFCFLHFWNFWISLNVWHFWIYFFCLDFLDFFGIFLDFFEIF